MDNRHLSVKELAILKKKAVEAVVIHGETQKRACELFGFSPTSMCKYIAEYQQVGASSLRYKKRGVKPGTHSKLTEQQIDALRHTILSHSPDELGLEQTLWTSKAIQYYVSEEFSVTYARRSLRDLMQRLGFSAQKPIKLAYQRNPEKIKQWLDVDYPKIKVLAMKEKARIYWGDEMGIQSTDNRGRCYGLKGQTPVIHRSGTRFKCNMLAATSPQGYMNWMIFTEHFTTRTFITFLGRLIRQIKQKVFLIVDNHRVHHSKRVKAYLAKHQSAIQLFYLPPYCPDLNPQELVNQDVKANANHFKALKTLPDLLTNVRYYLTTIQINPFKIMAFFNKKEVLYASA